jgi:hypothetical protein
MAGTTQGKSDDKVAQEIRKMTEAIRDLARDSRKPDGDDDPKRRRRIQRVDFGYQALGTLMGRVSRGSAAQFDVPVFSAEWDRESKTILLLGLPKGADWIELRNGKEYETLKVNRGRDEHDNSSDADTKGSRGGKQPPSISPTEFTPDKPIDSVLGLRHKHGAVVALGTRIAPVAGTVGHGRGHDVP